MERYYLKYVGSHVSRILLWLCQKHSERFDFSSCSDLGLGKGLQIQQKHGFHQESDRKNPNITNNKNKRKKVTELLLPMDRCFFKFCNEADVI